MAKIYKICYNDNLLDKSITLGYGTEYEAEQYYEGSTQYTIYKTDFTFSSDSTLESNLEITYKYLYQDGIDGDFDTVQTGQGTVTMLAGTSSASLTLTTRIRAATTYGYSTGSVDVKFYVIQEPTDVTVADQPIIPECGPDCTLVLDSLTSTDTSKRGVADGSITAIISGGQSGNYSWYLDGELITTGTTLTYTYNNLLSGDYQVMVGETLGDGTECYVHDNISVVDGEFATGNFEIYSNPGLVKAAHNPIISNIRTKTLTTEKIYYNGLINVKNVTINNNYSIQFKLTSPFEYTVTFYAKSFPNKTNYFFATESINKNGTVVSTNTQSDITQSLYEALSNDIVLSNNYDFKIVSGNEINIKSKNTGYKYDLNYNLNIFIYDENGDLETSTGGSIGYNLIQKSKDRFDGEGVDNYSIYAEVFINNNTEYPIIGDHVDYDKITDLVIPFQPDNNHIFDISTVVAPHVTTPRPVFDFDNFLLVKDFIKPINIRWGESCPIIQNSNTIKRRIKSFSSGSWVCNSSLDINTPNNMEDFVYEPKRFLSNSPNPTQIQRQQKLFFYFLIEKNYGLAFALYGDIYYWDGTSDMEQSLIEVPNPYNSGGLYVMNLGYDALGLDTYEAGNKKIKYLDFTVMNSDWVAVTETRRLMFNINEQPRKFSLMFQNRLGTYDSFDCIGITEEEIDREYGEYTINTDSNLDGAMRTGFKKNAVYNTKVTKKVTVNTGFLDEAHLDWLANDLLTSNNIYSINNDETEIYLILEKSNYVKSSQEDLFSIELEFKYTTYMNNLEI